MSTTITSAPTNAAATGYSNQKHGCTLSEGTLVVVEGDTTTNAKFYYSQNGGTSWTSYGSDIAGWSNGSIVSYVDTPGAVERIVAVWKQSGTGGTRVNGGLYVMVGTFNAGRTMLTWGTASEFLSVYWGAGNYPNLDCPDIAVNVEGTGGYAHIVHSYFTGGASQTHRSDIAINSSGVLGAQANAQVGATIASGAATSSFASIDIDPATKRYFIAWSAGKTGAGFGLRYQPFTYGAGPVWTTGTEVEVDNARYIPNSINWVNCRWNIHDSMVVLGGQLYNGSTYDIYQYESTNFTSIATSRALLTGQASGATNIFAGSLTIDTATGDSYYFGGAGNGTHLQNYKWTRSNTTLGAVVTLDTTFFSSVNEWVYAWFSGLTVRWVYTKGNASPFSVVYDQLVLNTAPTIAYGASSLVDASFPTTATPTLTAYVTDPDSSQTLTVTFDVATDAGFSSIVYTGTNTAASPQTAGAVSKTTTALSKATLYYWRARVSDGTATSANTATRTFTIYDDPTVTIGASTPATTVSTGGPTLNVGWTYAQGQTLAEAFYRVQVQSNGGATTYYDTGTLAGPTTAVALDAVALSIPTDTTGTALQVVVTVTAATTGTVVSTTKVFDIQWGVVTVGIVSPSNGAIVATTGITAQWTFASTRSKLQGSYRIRLMIASTGSVLLDTGFVTSAATSVAVAVVLVDGSTYSLEVTLKNDQGVLGT